MGAMSRQIKVTNTKTGTIWVFEGLRKTSEELHIDANYIRDYCTGKKKYFNGVYTWEFI